MIAVKQIPANRWTSLQKFKKSTLNQEVEDATMTKLIVTDLEALYSWLYNPLPR